MIQVEGRAKRIDFLENAVAGEMWGGLGNLRGTMHSPVVRGRVAVVRRKDKCSTPSNHWAMKLPPPGEMG